MRARRGFTLIELLVVIAIIAILAAILFPVFAKAREKARQSSCLSNVKQLMVGTLSYAQDYDEMLPGYWFNGAPAAGDQWYEVMTPYLKNTQILECPSVKNLNPGYGWNYRWISYGTADGGVSPITSLGALTAPSETVIIADSNQYYVRGPSITTTSYWPPARHNEGSNFGLADGHAKWYKAAQFQNSAGCLQWWP